MNIFFTNPNPHKCANEHCDVHQVKMILEYTQMLSAAHHVLGSHPHIISEIYEKAYENHPPVVWVRESRAHYNWLFTCLMQLHKLYFDRTGRVHKAYSKRIPLRLPPPSLHANHWNNPPVSAPDKFKAMGNTCSAYQAYLCEKFEEWQERERPIKVEWTCRRPTWYR